MKIAANLKYKMTEKKEYHWVTKAIHNLNNILKLIAINKFCSKLKINRFKTPNYA